MNIIVVDVQICGHKPLSVCDRHNMDEEHLQCAFQLKC